MERIVIFYTALLLGTLHLQGQPSITWQRCIGGTGEDKGFGCSGSTDNGFFVTGITQSGDYDMYGNHGGFGDAFVSKLDAAGTVQWTKVLGGSGYDVGRAVEETWDGGCIMVGSSSSNDGDVSGNHGESDIWVV